jgi:hypothetical protein
VAIAPPRRSNRVASISLDEEREKLLDAVAAGFGGSRSEAVRHLIDVHSGRALEQIDEAEQVEAEQVEPWQRRRLSRELIGEVAARIRQGATRADAYRLSGVTPGQASSWLTRGRADVRAGRGSVHADFVMHLEMVEAELRLERVRKVKDPKWLLERQSPEQYSRQSRVDSTVTHQYNLIVEWDRGTLDEARTLVALLRKFSPDADSPAVNRLNRPAYELVPAEIMAEVIEGEAVEADEDESPTVREAPALDTKAPSLDEPDPPAADVSAPPLGADRLVLERAADVGELEHD